MRKYLTSVLAVVLVLGAWIATLALTNPKSQIVAMSTSELEADISNGKKGLATFAIYNGTGKPAVIDRVVTSCACVPSGNHEGKTISPGESLKLAFTADIPTIGSRRT